MKLGVLSPTLGEIGGSDLQFTHLRIGSARLNFTAPFWSFSRVRAIICATAVYPAPPKSSLISCKLSPQLSQTITIAAALASLPLALRFNSFFLEQP